MSRRLLFVAIAATVLIAPPAVTANQATMTRDTLLATKWRLMGSMFSMVPLDGFPLTFHPDGTVETRNLGGITRWSLDGDELVPSGDRHTRDIRLKWRPDHGVSPSHVRLQAIAAWTDYDDFMKLSAHERQGRFVAMSAGNKATVVRQHVERWLRTNRGRLTVAETEIFEEMIAFITPDLYRERRDDTLDKREEAMTAKMRCRVSPEDVREATYLFHEVSESPPPRRKWSYFSQSKCWFEWVLEGVVDYLPSGAR